MIVFIPSIDIDRTEPSLCAGLPAVVSPIVACWKPRASSHLRVGVYLIIYPGFFHCGLRVARRALRGRRRVKGKTLRDKAPHRRHARAHPPSQRPDWPLS